MKTNVADRLGRSCIFTMIITLFLLCLHPNPQQDGPEKVRTRSGELNFPGLPQRWIQRIRLYGRFNRIVRKIFADFGPGGHFAVLGLDTNGIGRHDGGTGRFRCEQSVTIRMKRLRESLEMG